VTQTRTLEITIEVDARPAMAAFARAEKAIARLAVTMWRQRPDLNPMPYFRLFRWLPPFRHTTRSENT